MDDNDHANPSNMPDEAPDSKGSSASLPSTTVAAAQGGILAAEQRQLGDKPKISILDKLPREIREMIYTEVFKDAYIITKIVGPRKNKPNGSIDYKFEGDYGLIESCPTIKEEASTAMWRNAVWEFYGRDETLVHLHKVARVLPPDMRQHIAHIQGIYLPQAGTSKFADRCFTAYQQLFPRLQTCGFEFVNPWHRTSFTWLAPSMNRKSLSMGFLGG